MSDRTQDEVAQEQERTAAAFSSILERGKVVWIVFGVYQDRSGSKILGVYASMEEAHDRVQLAREADAIYNVNYAKVPIGRAFTVDLNP